jgi:hypothetical protein
MTIKEGANEREPEIVYAEATPFPEGNTVMAVPADSSTASPPVQPPPPVKPLTTSTTTTYTIPPPGQQYSHGTMLAGLGRSSVPIQCPHCHQNTRTIVSSTIDCFTISMCILLLICFWPLFWLPFVIPDCKTTDHNCASCGRKVGTEPACADCCK